MRHAMKAVFYTLFVNVMETSYFLWLAYRRYRNWRLVRSLGELQILTRASYVMLIVVPLLAGMWPAVRLVVNQHNKALTDAAALFDRAATRFSEVQLRGASLNSERQAQA